MARLVKVISKLKPRKVGLKSKKHNVLALPFKKQWPKLLAWMVEHPNAKTKDVWNHWASKLEGVHSYQHFFQLLKKNALTPQEVRAKTSVKAQAALAITTFSEVKKTHAEHHMRRIHKGLEKVHTIVEGLEPDQKNVGAYLDLVGKLHREGRIAYDIDDEIKGDKKVTNLAVLIGFDPTEQQPRQEKLIEAKVISQ